MGRQTVGMDELVEHWTVLDGELELVAGKRGGTRLGASWSHVRPNGEVRLDLESRLDLAQAAA